MTCLWLSRSTLPSDKPVGAQQNFRLASNTQFKTVGWRSGKTIPSSLRMPVLPNVKSDKIQTETLPPLLDAATGIHLFNERNESRVGFSSRNHGSNLFDGAPADTRRMGCAAAFAFAGVPRRSVRN
jgi:hypothetical protein